MNWTISNVISLVGYRSLLKVPKMYTCHFRLRMATAVASTYQGIMIAASPFDDINE